ncbi:MAG: amidohydrolase family protein, partial [Gemmatimonadaceae bacterium]
SVWSGHGVILNSALLKSFGYDTLTNVPLGGFIERDGSGRPTGLVHEYAWWSVSARSEASQPIAALRAAHERYAMEALRMGITSVQQMSSLDPEIALLVACGAETPLRVRLIAMPMTTARGRTGTTFSSRACPPGSAGQVTVSGTKYVLDGTPVERFAFERLPYADRPNERGHLNFPPDSLAVFLRESLDRRDQLVLHAVGDSTISLVLETMRRVAPDSVWRAMRVRIEHGDGLPPDRFKQARELGIVFVQNGTHLAIAPLVAQRYSAGRRARLQPLASLRREGLPFALGSDGAPHPFLDIMLATMHPDNPMEALSREDAVRAYTRGSAFAEGAEQEKGGLGVGMLADLAMLSQDIFTIELRALPSTVSVLTVVGGKVAYDGRRPPASTLPRVRGDG